MTIERTGTLRRALWVSVPLLVVVAACSPATGSSAEDAPTPGQVAIGYGTESRADVTGAVSSITTKELQHEHVMSLAEFLATRVPGLTMVQRPDGDYSVRIRGATREGVTGEPLVVVDGTEVLSQRLMSVLDEIRPEDVQRIDVIKDGSAAVYGIHGGNGVIVITTKRGH